MRKTLDELMTEYEPERLRDLARDDTPEAEARRVAKHEADIQREIRQGLRDANGDWIEPEGADADFDNAEEDDD